VLAIEEAALSQPTTQHSIITTNSIVQQQEQLPNREVETRYWLETATLNLQRQQTDKARAGSCACQFRRLNLRARFQANHLRGHSKVSFQVPSILDRTL